ncbi:DNA/RNA non-specific endonuclease [Segatella oris]|uniref:DNA/RNA non-specific endonuclease n=1 Tax=Segatella oris TaxID=28135 RepID=UPI0028F1590D|nr:DNA/RNA non-specific endonuclease [Segatella oris]
MKKIILHGFVFLTLLFGASGCDFAKGGHKPLIGGVRQSVETYEANRAENSMLETAQTADSTSISGLLMQQIPKEMPQQLLRRVGYVVSYNSKTSIPNWVAWHLTAAHTTGPYKREGIGFQEDRDVEGVKVNTFDYNRSGYDRGHMCPSADNKWSQKAQEQSFLMTNVCPQNRNLNVGDWNEMENQCRKWAKQYGSVYIVAGPILYHQKHKTIGKAKVVVPEAFFKVVLCMEGTPKAIGFIYKNEAGNRPKGDYVNSIDAIERITGFDFFPALEDALEAKVEAEANLSDW